MSPVRYLCRWGSSLLWTSRRQYRMYLRVVPPVRSENIGILVSMNIGVFVFYGCYNTWPQMWCWRTTEIYSLNDLEVRNWKSLSLEWCCQQGLAPSRGCRGESVPCLFPFWWLLAFLDFWLLHHYQLLWSHCLFLFCLCEISLCLSLIRTYMIVFRGPLDSPG